MQCVGHCLVCELPRGHTGTHCARGDHSSGTELRGRLGRSYCVCCRQYRQRKWRELQSQLVDAGQRPGDKQWRQRQRSAVDVAGRLRHVAFTDANSNAHTHSDTNSYTHAHAVTLG